MAPSACQDPVLLQSELEIVDDLSEWSRGYLLTRVLVGDRLKVEAVDSAYRCFTGRGVLLGFIPAETAIQMSGPPERWHVTVETVRAEEPLACTVRIEEGI